MASWQHVLVWSSEDEKGLQIQIDPKVSSSILGVYQIQKGKRKNMWKSNIRW